LAGWRKGAERAGICERDAKQKEAVTTRTQNETRSEGKGKRKKEKEIKKIAAKEKIAASDARPHQARPFSSFTFNVAGRKEQLGVELHAVGLLTHACVSNPCMRIKHAPSSG
jgi:hypothetical protein